MIFTADLSQRSHPQLEHTFDWLCELTVKSCYVSEYRRSGCSSWALSTAQHSSLEGFENVISHVTVLRLTQETAEVVLPPGTEQGTEVNCGPQSNLALTGDSASPFYHQHQPEEKKIWLNIQSRNTQDSSVFVTEVTGPKLPAAYMYTPHHQPRQHQHQVRHEPSVLVEIRSQKDSKRFLHVLANRFLANKGSKLLIENN